MGHLALSCKLIWPWGYCGDWPLSCQCNTWDWSGQHIRWWLKVSASDVRKVCIEYRPAQEKLWQMPCLATQCLVKVESQLSWVCRWLKYNSRIPKCQIFWSLHPNMWRRFRADEEFRAVEIVRVAGIWNSLMLMLSGQQPKHWISLWLIQSCTLWTQREAVRNMLLCFSPERKGADQEPRTDGLSLLRKPIVLYSELALVVEGHRFDCTKLWWVCCCEGHW